MYNRYQGNSGKVVRVREAHDHGPIQHKAKPADTGAKPGQEFTAKAPAGTLAPPLRLPSFVGGGLGKLLSGSLGGLETEDIILLLILYLMYRESGDSELLIMMGAMFLL